MKLRVMVWLCLAYVFIISLSLPLSDFLFQSYCSTVNINAIAFHLVWIGFWSATLLTVIIKIDRIENK